MINKIKLWLINLITPNATKFVLNPKTDNEIRNELSGISNESIILLLKIANNYATKNRILSLRQVSLNDIDGARKHEFMAEGAIDFVNYVKRLTER